MLQKLKEIGLFVWNWITVLVTTLIGLLLAVQPILDIVLANFQPIMEPQTGAVVMALVGTTKGILALYQTYMLEEH